jgi:hypothetical protein
MHPTGPRCSARNSVRGGAQAAQTLCAHPNLPVSNDRVGGRSRSVALPTGRVWGRGVIFMCARQPMSTPGDEMDVSEFLRLHHIRAPNIMWFLGAGASAAAGVPTAGDMIWDFKRRLYCAAQRVPISTCQDLGDPVLRDRLQRHFDSIGTFPALGDNDEYAVYFETVYRDEADRRRYIDQKIADATPSYGHHGLAALLAMGRIQIIWTTNFDRVPEDAAAGALGGTARLVVADLDRAVIAREALDERRWPLLVKLHGDFQSRWLKNTSEELREQDQHLRRALISGCGRFGLAVVGYSGRDDSVMRALEEVLEADRAFPAGLFWFHRPDGPAPARVTQLIDRAAAQGVDAHLIEIETFDELVGALLVLEDQLHEHLRHRLDPRGLRLTEAPVPPPGSRYPVVRLNALPVLSVPAVCRVVKCGIGNAKELREAVEHAEAKIIAGRRRVGVLAFGHDAEVQRALEPFKIESLDVTELKVHKLRYSDSVETSMILEGITGALVRGRPVRAEIRRSRYSRYTLVVDKDRSDAQLFHRLRQVTGIIEGQVPDTDLEWAEALQLRLDHRLGRLWLLLLPGIWIERTEDEAAMELAREFRRARVASRYNAQANAVLDAWVHLIFDGSAATDLSAFGLSEGEGIDASFTLGATTAFSRRDGAQAPPITATAVAAATRGS